MTHSPIIRRTFAVIVDNEPVVLSRVVGQFAGRGYNIERLIAAAVEAGEHSVKAVLGTANQWLSTR